MILNKINTKRCPIIYSISKTNIYFHCIENDHLSLKLLCFIFHIKIESLLYARIPYSCVFELASFNLTRQLVIIYATQILIYLQMIRKITELTLHKLNSFLKLNFYAKQT